MKDVIRQLWLTFLFGLLVCSNVKAQELQAKVTINHNQIQGTDASVFENLQQTLEQFINDRQWTNLQFQKKRKDRLQFQHHSHQIRPKQQPLHLYGTNPSQQTRL